MIEWLIKFLIIWLSLDIMILAIFWYFAFTAKIFLPKWWRNNVVSEFEPPILPLQKAPKKDGVLDAKRYFYILPPKSRTY